jgi:hypothetical protein
LLLFQSVPNAVAGRVAMTWGLAGPLICISPVGEPLSDGLALVRLLIEDGDADDALLVLVEQAGVEGELDQATAMFVRPSSALSTNRSVAASPHRQSERTTGGEYE